MNDGKLIKLVRLYPVLYDMSHSKYMDTAFKYTVWKQIAKEMREDVTSCKTRWNNIRDNYRRSLKKAAKNGIYGQRKHKVYKYSDELEFLLKFFNERDNKGYVDYQEEENRDQAQDNLKLNTEELNDAENCALDQPTASEETFPTQSMYSPTHTNTVNTRAQILTRKGTKRKPAALQQNSPYRLMEYLIKKNETHSNPSGLHPVDSFLASIGSTLKTFHPYYLHWAKSEIFTTVQKYELKMLTNQYPESITEDSAEGGVESYSEVPLSDAASSIDVDEDQKFEITAGISFQKDIPLA